MLAGQFWQYIFGMPQVVIIMGCLVPIVGIIASYWYKAQKLRHENNLKRTMVERGMSVDEIERIMAAKSDEHDSGR